MSERLAGTAGLRWDDPTMCEPVPRSRYRHLAARVVAVTEVAAAVRRVTLGGLAEYRPQGPDEYLGLFLPRPGVPLVLPEEDGLRVHAALARLDEAVRPDLRWYTMRAHRGDEIDIDIICHGDEGPGTAWARRVAVGDEVGVRQGSAAYRPPAVGQGQLIVADETAIPALAGIISAARAEPSPAWAGVRAVVEIPDAEHAAPLPQAPFAVVIRRRMAGPGSGVLPEVHAVRRGAVASAWVCGEARVAAAVRRHLVRQVGVDRRKIFFSGYWKLGQARG